MKILIAEDDSTSCLFMKRYLSRYGTCDVAMNGLETIELVKVSIELGKHYDLICLDIMMPKVNGLKALRIIRELENASLPSGMNAAKIILTTALNDKETVEEAYRYGCNNYAWKPIDIERFDEILKELELI